MTDDYKAANAATKLVFDNIKNILTIGAVYYIINKYQHEIAESVTVALLLIFFYPLNASAFIYMLPQSWSDIRIIIISSVTLFLVSLVMSLFALAPLIRVVASVTMK